MKGKVVRGAVLAIAVAALAPGAAIAAQITVTGDAGSPVALNPAAPTPLRNTDITVTVNKDVGDGNISLVTRDPTGAVAGTEDGSFCWIINGVNDYPKYRGNGTYTVTVVVHTADNCTSPVKATIQAQYTINAGVAMTAPPGPVLTRNANSSASNTYNIPIALNPGIGSYDVHYAAGAVIAPDGSISGPSQTSFVDTQNGTASASFERPGTYTFVARGSADSYFTPWSAPIQVRAVAPFDLATGGLTFPDSRGPRYKLRAKLGEKTASGRVYISYARGSKGTHYHTLGYARISGAGTISKRFTLRKTGTYKLRFRFKGSTTTAAGDVRVKVRITRRVVL
jgi:hypothetical protein